MRSLGLFTILAALTCWAPTAKAEVAPYTLVDLTDDYAAFYDRTEGMAPEARVAAFRAEFNALFPGFYDIARMPRSTQARYDASIAGSFARFPAIRERYTRIAADFSAMLAPAHASFSAAFSDIAPIGDIHLLHSLGEMDGGVRQWGGRYYFVFGADMMASVHAFDDEEPFFHHELFHVYHRQFFAGCMEIWCALWMEGLATHAALELNPDASEDQLLLNLPEPIRASVDAHRAEAVCAVRARLDANRQNEGASLFSFTRLNERLPPRFGYYVGFLVAREAARTRSTQALAHLSVEEARPVMDAALALLANCSGAHQPCVLPSQRPQRPQPAISRLRGGSKPTPGS